MQDLTHHTHTQTTPHTKKIHHLSFKLLWILKADLGTAIKLVPANLVFIHFIIYCQATQTVSNHVRTMRSRPSNLDQNFSSCPPRGGHTYSLYTSVPRYNLLSDQEPTFQTLFSTSPIRCNLSKPHMVPGNSSLDPACSKNESQYLQVELVPVTILGSPEQVALHTGILVFLSRRLQLLFQHPYYPCSVYKYQYRRDCLLPLVLLPFIIRKF